MLVVRVMSLAEVGLQEGESIENALRRFGRKSESSQARPADSTALS